MKIVYFVLSFFAMLLKLRCYKPRLRDGVAAMAPQVIRDRFSGMYCKRWKYHPGPCESRRGESGDLEQWS